MNSVRRNYITVRHHGLGICLSCGISGTCFHRGSSVLNTQQVPSSARAKRAVSISFSAFELGLATDEELIWTIFLMGAYSEILVVQHDCGFAEEEN